MRIFYAIAALAIVALLGIFSWTKYQQNEDRGASTIITVAGPVKIYTDIASTPEARERGLMFKEKLDKNNGLLFIWPDENPRSFWMKNTLIPLDLMFIPKDHKVVETASLEPCQTNPCSLYTSSASARYVIEVNKGFAEKNRIQNGDVFLLPESVR